jgi:ABC-type sugar transport system substrate-binding protein
MKRSLKMLLLLIIISSLLVGCGSNGANSSGANTPADANSGNEKLKIGLSIDTLTNEFNTKLLDAINAYYDSQNLKDTVELIIVDSNKDTVKQNAQVDNLITQQVDAIILIAGDGDQLVPAVEASVNAGIPLIEFVAGTSATETRTSFVGSDDFVAGTMLAEQLFELKGGKGKVVELQGPSGHICMLRRNDGMMDTLKKYPDIEIVATKVCNWSREESMKAMENIIQSKMEFDIVYAQNDEMAMGALNALKGSGIDLSQIAIGGIDAIDDCLEAVANGEVYGTVYLNSVALGQKVMEVAIQAAKGESIEPL